MTKTHRGTGNHRRHGNRLIGVAAVSLAVVCAITAVAFGSTSHRSAVADTAVTARAASIPDTPASPHSTASSPPSPLTTSAKPSASAVAASSAASPAAAGGSAPSSTSLAGRIRPGVTYHGVATEYAAADGNGACLFGPAADMMIAAMNYTDYENSKACGDHILVRASDGATITVLITNECPLPCAPGQLDLSQQAFAKLANPAAGRISVTWQLISPSDAGTISFRYKTGSSQWWCGIQTSGERNPVAELEVRTGNGWVQLPRTSYNYFLSAHGAGCGGAIRITDIYGQQLVASSVSLRPDVLQSTQLQFAQH